MGIWNLSKYLYKMIRHHPVFFILLLVVLSGLLRLWSGANGSDNTRPANPPKTIFKDAEFVKDVYSGSLMERNLLMHLSDVSIVFFYAPWCRSSMLAANQFAQTAKIMHNQISFIAVNCWWSKGECRRTMKLVGYPQLLLYHPNSDNPILYKGPHLSIYYNNFLRKALNPVVYLDSSKKVESFIKNNQTSYTFRKYVETALIGLEQYPSIALNFGVILSKKLSSEFALKQDDMNLYDSSVNLVQPCSRFLLKRNTTMKSVIEWAVNRTMALHVIASCNSKSNALHRVLKQGPTLMTFYTNFDQLHVFNDVAIRYHARSNPPWPCCQSTDSTGRTVCMKNMKSSDCQQSCAMLSTLTRFFSTGQRPVFLPSNGGCGQFRPLYDSDRTRLEVCVAKSPATTSSDDVNATQTEVDGLFHRTNMSLLFLALDYNLVPGIADTLGFTPSLAHPPFTVILDLKNEQKYAMRVSYTTSDIEQFILNYTNHLLAPTYHYHGVETGRDDKKIENQVDIPAVQAHEFEAKVLASAKDVLVYYHTHWCGGCLACSDSLLHLRVNHPNLSNLIVYQVTERTNELLPHSFRALSFPTVILYPGNRTSDSVVFSSSSCSLSNVVDFLIRYASPSAKAELILDLCDFYRDDASFQVPVDVCKQRNILERLTR